jgi:hypothetical protein
MRGAIPPVPHYDFMAWCSVKAHGRLYSFYLYLREFYFKNQAKFNEFLSLISV